MPPPIRIPIPGIMKITLDISNENFNMIETTAKELGVTPEQLMQSLLNDQITSTKEDFDHALHYVLEKNQELYDRLS